MSSQVTTTVEGVETLGAKRKFSVMTLNESRTSAYVVSSSKSIRSSSSLVAIERFPSRGRRHRK